MTISLSASIAPVPSEYLDTAWPKAVRFIRQAMERGDLGLYEEVRDQVFAGAALLWIAWDAGDIIGAGVTMVQTTERSRPCTIIAWGSEDMAATLPLLATIEAYAKARGCDCVRLFGRKGWERVLKDYRPAKIVLERRI